MFKKVVNDSNLDPIFKLTHAVIIITSSTQVIIQYLPFISIAFNNSGSPKERKVHKSCPKKQKSCVFTLKDLGFLNWNIVRAGHILGIGRR